MIRKSMMTLGVLLLAIFFLMPIGVMVSNSFMEPQEVMKIYEKKEDIKEYMIPRFIPEQVSITQYRRILLEQTVYLKMFWNSVKIVVPIIVGQILISAPAAYGFAKFEFPYREPLFFIYVMVMLMPFQVTLVPNYMIADQLGMIGKLDSIIWPGIFSAFGVFLLRQFMMSIPDSYLEAAKVDGAGHITIFHHIIFPMIQPGIASLCMLLLIDYWNLVEQPLIFLSDRNLQPLSTYLTVIGEKDFNIAFAASVIYMIPVVLGFLYWENDLIEGIQLSGIK